MGRLRERGVWISGKGRRVERESKREEEREGGERETKGEENKGDGLGLVGRD